jgi:hypothetical protein
MFGQLNTHIDVGNLSKYATGNELTISLWAKNTTTATNCLFEIINDTPHDRCVGCAQYNNGSTTMMIWDWGSIYSTGGRQTNTGVAHDVTNWHHYVYVVSQSGNFKKMYLDGVSVATASYVQSCVNKNKPLYIGSSTDTTGGTLQWHGPIDEICIYNRGLNQNEVSALFNGTGVCFNVGIKELENIQTGMFYELHSNEFGFTGNAAKIKDIEIYTPDGKLIKKLMELDSPVLILHGLSPGLYIVRYYQDERIAAQKVIIRESD